MATLNISFYRVSKLDPRYSQHLCDLTNIRSQSSVDFVLNLMNIEDYGITINVQKDWFENLFNKLKTMKSQMMPGMEYYNIVEYILCKINLFANEIDWNLDNVEMCVEYWD